jgi:hypothetical protein
MPELPHEARRVMWSTLWVLFPYLPYIEYLWPLRVFRCQRGPGEPEPLIPVIPQFNVEPAVFPCLTPPTPVQHEADMALGFDLEDYHRESVLDESPLGGNAGDEPFTPDWGGHRWIYDSPF